MSLLSRSLTSRILTIALGATAAIVAVTLWSVFQDRARTLRSSENYALSIARAMAEHTARSLDAVDLTLSNIKKQAERDRRSTPRPDQEIIAEFEGYIASLPQIRGLILTDKNGIIRYTERKKSIGMDVHDRSYFTVHKDNAETGFFIGNPLKGRTTGRWFFSTSRRIVDQNGAFDGIAMALVTQSYFTKVYEKAEQELNVSLAYATENGKIFAASPGFSDDRSDVSGLSVDLNIGDADIGTFTRRPFNDSKPRIISYVAVPNASIYIIASIPVDTALAAWQERTVMLALLVTAALILLTWLTYIASRHVRRREAAETQLSQIFHIAPEALIIIDGEGKIQRFNEGAERIFQYSAAEVIGSNFDILIPEHLRNRHQNLVDQFAKSNSTYLLMDERNTVIGCRKDGTEFSSSISVSKLTTNERIIFTIILRDVSVRQRLEEQLQQAQKMEAVGQLTGGLAHDFNNLLGVIMGNVELLLEQTKNPEISAFANKALAAGQRGAELAHRLLAFSRRQPLQPKLLDVNQLVLGMQDLLARTLSEDIRLEIVGGKDLWSCAADPGQLENAILNLSINARDAMPKGGTLTIETANDVLSGADVAGVPDVSPGQYILLTVSDTGRGMPQDVIDQAFDPFFTTKAVGKGSGLGLSMIYGFVKQSDGHAWIQSEVGKGTSIKIYLPRSAPDTLSGTESAI